MDSTSLKIIKGAKGCFFSKGISKTSVVDICTVSGVSKMTFYRKFKNKEAVLIAFLQHYYAQNQKQFEQLVADSDSFQNLNKKLIEIKLKGSEEMSPTFIQELLATSNAEILKVLALQREKSLNQFIQICKEAQLKGELRTNFNLQLIPILQEYFLQMFKDPRIRELYTTNKEMMEDLLLTFFHGLNPRNHE